MKKRPLGRSGLNVSEICLGTMTWGQQNTQEDAFAQMDYALGAGVTFWDTAELYSVPPKTETYGSTETIIGNWFAKTNKRSEIILATKMAGGGFPWIRGGEGLNPKKLEEALNASLKRLQTDYVDLYQLHWPNRPHYHFARNWTYDASGQNKEQILDHMGQMLLALKKQVDAGKIRAIGLSNETSWGVKSFLQLAEDHNLPRVVSVQNEYSLLKRLFDLDMAETCLLENVGLLAYTSLAGGLLSGKYLDGSIPKGTRAELIPDIHGRKTAYSEGAVKAYVELAKQHNLDPCQLAISFVLSRPFVTSVIIGATNMDQLKTNIEAAEKPLNQDILTEIAAIYRQHPAVF